MLGLRPRHATRLGVATCWIGPGANHMSVIAKMGSRFDEDRRDLVDLLRVFALS